MIPGEGCRPPRRRARDQEERHGPKSSMIANSLERGFEDFGAVLQTGLLFVREFRLQNIDDAAALILKHHLGDPDRYDSDTILTGIVTFDDSDVGVANLFLDSLSEIFEVLTALLE